MCFVTDIMPTELQNSHRKVKFVFTIHHDGNMPTLIRLTAYIHAW